jgi:tetratricopeptide (TPR) repeat protein
VNIARDMDLAMQFHRAGDFREAESRYRTIVRAEPSQSTAWHLLGAARHMQAKFDEAVEAYQQALRLAPNDADVHNDLGMAYRAQGRLSEAVASYREAVRIDPSSSSHHNNLGAALLDQGAVDAAMASFREALRLKPDFPEAHHNLGLALQQQGNFDDAEACYRRALELKPGYIDAYNNLGVVLTSTQRFDEATACLRQALALDPSRADTYNNLGHVLKSQERFKEAAAYFHRALELQPALPEAHNNLAATLDRQGRPEEALGHFREALRLKPDYADAHANMGTLLEQLGDLPAAQASFREALRIDPRHVLAFTDLVGLLEGRLADADLAVLNDLLADSRQPENPRSRLHFAAARVYDARGEFDQAVQHLQAANAFQIGHFRKSGQVYDPVAHTRLVDRVIATFTPELFARFRGWGLDSERPVFIFGLPRSGTTLTEQILASHSCVHGAGEIGLGQEAFNFSAPASLESISASALGQIAEQLLSRLRALNASAARVIDKMPDNYLHVGLLAALFPHAHFIHCQRDVRDVAVSCWLTGFTKLHWANEPDHIALRIRDYQRLMQHWRKVLPVTMLEVSYETVVADLEGQARRLVAGCGLEWEPACLAFYETRRPVRTASIMQVRQPIYSRSVGRWQKYADALAPLLSQLDPTGTQEYADALAPPLFQLDATGTEIVNVARDMDLALQLLQAGRFPEAESRYRTIVRAEPSHSTAWSLLGGACHMQAKLDDAVASYQQALRLEPHNADVHNNLGLAYGAQGRLSEAVASYREAARIDPLSSSHHNNLGAALLHQGAVDAAMASFRDAVGLTPGFPEAHYNLGVALQQQGKLDDAEACIRRALQLRPEYTDAYNKLGVVLACTRRFEEAAACLRQALALDPSRADAHNNLGHVLMNQERLDEAATCFQHALGLLPEYPEALNNLAVTLDRQGRPEEALAPCREAIRLKPDYAGAHANMGGLLEQLGDLTAAQASLREALRIDPRHVPALTALVNLLEGRLSDTELAVLNDLIADPLQPDDLRSRLHFAAARVCDVRGEYEEAAQHLRAANALQGGDFRKSGQVYDPVAHTRLVDRVITTFTPELFARFRGWGLDSERPIFIFGLPRSGTTLIEQILASHSRVHGAGEVGLGREAFNSLPAAGQGQQAALASLESISANAFEQIAKQILSRVQALNASAARVIDKMPHNYLHLGLLAALFPHARFIHCQRDVRDVAVSCWLTSFDKLRWANEPDHIASRIRDYQRLMQHWREVLPVPILEVSYEAVVADLEGQARRLVAGCGLEWEPACLAFSETRRAVRTASMLQVRQPIYSRSVGRWQKYADALAPLLSQLDATGT